MKKRRSRVVRVRRFVWLPFALLPYMTYALSAPCRELRALSQRFEQTAFVGNALARDIEGRSVVNRSTDHRQADGDIHAGLQSQHLDRAMTLIMIHRNDHVVVAAAGEKKQRVRRQRALHIPAAALTSLDGGRDFRCFLTSTE